MVVYPCSCWCGKEGYREVIILEHLGTSLDDLISVQNFDHRKTFFFASRMVCSLYTYGDLIELFPQLSAWKTRTVHRECHT
jgi:hypothetical protein